VALVAVPGEYWAGNGNEILRGVVWTYGFLCVALDDCEGALVFDVLHHEPVVWLSAWTTWGVAMTVAKSACPAVPIFWSTQFP